MQFSQAHFCRLVTIFGNMLFQEDFANGHSFCTVTSSALMGAGGTDMLHVCREVAAIIALSNKREEEKETEVSTDAKSPALSREDDENKGSRPSASRRNAVLVDGCGQD